MFRKALYMLSLLLRTTSISLLMMNGPEEEDASPAKDARDDESEVELPSDVPEFWLDL
jgi:hypothetical protein